ncbi:MULTISPECIES: ABC transporter permease [Rhizobium]|uniref:ABC transporter permease subunit n=1 Tax=Rhizobium tropici TaxID=398 RepID=A0A6P1CAL7_RHITR|nr:MULTISPECIES: ABC transporter permease subunit [Rhizobium]MBB4240641.1 polar amino acid transport system permease protein [Rhizobium tropici]MBB5591942.1 polar amino acid transport system permease protein [Rhizobium tropici]MBB6490996.1 polar amino acid transport system permease protein [Rhizobium tropici]NEV12653.1 ABC transporter permease subunit [Rhizobium tropici]TGF01000.1 ABC transporter permease [Rhizobium sp. SEMIA 4088]
MATSSQGILDLLSPYPPGWGGVLLTGAASTVAISAGAFLIGLLLGTGGALGKLSGIRPLRLLLELYTTTVRAVPELILIVGLYYAGMDGLNRLLAALSLPAFELNGFAVAVAVLGFVQGAYMTEVLRGAILAIPVGQIEAAKAFGMGPQLRFRRIILPALLPNALPGLANLWMSVTKDSALVAVVGYQELALATRLAGASTKHYFIFFLASAFIYLALTLVSNALFNLLERRVRRGQPKLA